MAFPLFVLAMGIVAALGNSVANIVYATAIINLPIYARLARAEANVRRNAGFIEAARLCGNGEARIVLTQLLPNILPLMMVQVSLTLGYAILNAAGLSFIGLGVRPPTAEWGIMVAEGASNIISGEWWVALFPGLVLMAAVFCFNLMGDGLRDIVDPQRRTDGRSAMSNERNPATIAACPLLAVEDLRVEFRTRSGTVQALDGIGFELRRGEMMALGRRKRLGQVGHRLRDHGHSRCRGADHLGANHVRRPRAVDRRRKGRWPKSAVASWRSSSRTRAQRSIRSARSAGRSPTSCCSTAT